MSKTSKKNETAAKLMTLHDCVWQLGNTLRDCMNRLETIKETNPELCVESEIAQAKHTLERYAKGPMFYKPHPFGWPFDAYVLKDALAAFAPTAAEIKVSGHNADVDLPDTAAQDSASKSNSPAVSG